MTASLLERIHGCLTPAAVQGVSAFLDERPSSTEAAMCATVPALLLGLVDRTTTPASAETLLTVINRVGQSVDLPELSFGEAPFDDLVRSGHSVLGTIFGGLSRAVVAQVATTSGLRSLSASALTAMLAPIVLAVIGREVAAKRSSPCEVVRLLADQRDEATRALPSTLVRLFAGAGDARAVARMSVGQTRPPMLDLDPPVAAALLPEIMPTQETSADSRRQTMLMLALIIGVIAMIWVLRERYAPQSTQWISPKIVSCIAGFSRA